MEQISREHSKQRIKIMFDDDIDSDAILTDEEEEEQNDGQYNLETEIVSLKQQLKLAEKQNLQTQIAYESQSIKFYQQLAEANNTINNLKVTLDKKDTEILSLQVQIKQQVLNAKSMNIDSVQPELDTLKNSILTLKDSEINRLNLKINNYKLEIKRANDDNIHLQNAFNEMKTIVSNLNNVLKIQNEELELLRLEVDTMQLFTLKNQNDWRFKKINKWTNDDILYWIYSFNLDSKLCNTLMQQIKSVQCNGKDIKTLNSVNEIGEAFNITNNKSLCDKMYQTIKNLKETKQNNVESNHDNNSGENKFKINIYSQNKYIQLNELVTKSVTVRYVKELYKEQSDISATLDDIMFYSHLKLLPQWKTLEQVNIVDEKHLITIKFGAHGASFAYYSEY
eukprot:101338_1